MLLLRRSLVLAPRALRPALPRLPLQMPAVSRGLCSTDDGAAKPKSWDAARNVHGRREEGVTGTFVQEEAKAKQQRPRSESAAAGDGHGASGQFAARGVLSVRGRADMVQFQAYVRQRLTEMASRMPQRRGKREQAELAFLEDQVVQDHMPRRKRALRDPLKDVPQKDIQHTNLNLLSRFVSDAGAILPRKLTGVKRRKQKAITKALKRAHVLALLPRTWKLPKYRHVSYADQYSRPERDRARAEDDEFRDAPDIRFPNQWDRKRGVLDIDLTRLARTSRSMPPPSASPLGSGPAPQGARGK